MIHPEFPEPKSRVVWKTIGKAVIALACLSILFVLVSPIFEMTTEHRGPSPCKRNLRQIGLALQAISAASPTIEIQHRLRHTAICWSS
jgi:hypothetical protein